MSANNSEYENENIRNAAEIGSAKNEVPIIVNMKMKLQKLLMSRLKTMLMKTQPKLMCQSW